MQGIVLKQCYECQGAFTREIPLDIDIHSFIRKAHSQLLIHNLPLEWLGKGN